MRPELKIGVLFLIYISKKWKLLFTISLLNRNFWKIKGELNRQKKENKEENY